MKSGFKNSGFCTFTFSLSNGLNSTLLASSSFFSISCFFTKPSSSAKASGDFPLSHIKASSAALTRCCVRSHDGDSGIIDKFIRMNRGKIPAMKATLFQCRKVPRMWHNKIPKEIESVMEARRKPRYFGSLLIGRKKLRIYEFIFHLLYDIFIIFICRKISKQAIFIPHSSSLIPQITKCFRKFSKISPCFSDVDTGRRTQQTCS